MGFSSLRTETNLLVCFYMAASVVKAWRTLLRLSGPNGCSLQPPESRTFQEVVRNFRGSKVGIYIIEKDTELPSDLVILHEHSDHYSLQATKEMPLTRSLHFSSMDLVCLLIA